MRICILCEDQHLKAVKEKEKSKSILSVPVSESGSLPATHWFCVMAVNEEKANLLLSKKELCVMELSEPKEFLEKWNLKIIK